MKKTRPSNASMWAAGLALFSLLLLCLIGVSLLDVWRAYRSASWPTTYGLIVESTSAYGCRRQGSGHRPRVRYTYEIDGAKYQSRQFQIGAASCYSSRAAKAIQDQFPVAATVKVAYDPQDPSEAVLIVGKVDESTWTGVYFMSFWFLLVAGATGMAASVARSERRPSRGLPAQRTLGSGP